MCSVVDPDIFYRLPKAMQDELTAIAQRWHDAPYQSRAERTAADELYVKEQEGRAWIKADAARKRAARLEQKQAADALVAALAKTNELRLAEQARQASLATAEAEAMWIKAAERAARMALIYEALAATAAVPPAPATVRERELVLA